MSVGTIVRFSGTTDHPNRKHTIGQSERTREELPDGLSLMEAFDLFPDDAAAERWFAEARWATSQPARTAVA